MAINGPGVRGSNPLWYYVNLTGQAFNDTYYMYVLENTVPYIPTPVYHDAALTIPWTDPVQFLANGTLPIDVFWDPSKFYRLEFRHNIPPAPPSQADPLIYLVENYSPTNQVQVPPGGEGVSTENQITNPQFAQMNFSDQYILTGATNPPAIDIAPGWQLILTGTGNVTIDRSAFNTNTATQTNAPYALHINLTGWSNRPILRQRFQQNGQNWQNQYISASLTGRVNGPDQQILVRLDASNGQPLEVLMQPQLTNTFTEFSASVLIPPYINLNTPPDSFIDFDVYLNGTGDYYLTSFQVVASGAQEVFAYEQTTVDRQIDHTFHYWFPDLVRKPIPSYLVGWDFPLNPAQLGTAFAAQNTGANTGYYTWDQTLLFQTVTSSATVSRGTDGSFQLTCAADGQFALIQYLPKVEAQKIFNNRASVNIAGYTNIANGIVGNVTLWGCTDANLPNAATGTNLVGVSALSALGVPTMGHGTWVQMSNVYQNTLFGLELHNAAAPTESLLNGWDFAGNAAINTSNFFAIVVAFDPMVVGNIINLNSIGLCSGDLATRPAPKTAVETLSDCQEFYWKTFITSTVPVQNAGADSGYVQYQVVNAAGDSVYHVRMQDAMRTIPVIVTYNPAQANASIWNFNTTTVAASTSVGNITSKTFTVDAGATGGWASGNILGFHATADARLGIVN